MAISMLKIRRPLGRLIFNMGIAIPGKTVFLIETAPSCFANDIFIDISLKENLFIFYSNITEVILQGPIVNKSALVGDLVAKRWQVIAWPMLTMASSAISWC